MKQGISILFAILILNFVLSIALGTSILLIRQIKTTKEIGSSVIAFYAADNGIEEFLLVRTAVSGTLDGAEYEVIVNASTTPGCDAQNYCVKSIGTYRNTSRAIEITY